MTIPRRRRFHVLRSLGRSDATVVLCAVGYWTALRLAVWVTPSAPLLRYVRNRVDRAVPRSSGQPASRIAWAIRAVGRRMPRSTCLVEALAAQLLLARHGHASKLQIGVNRGATGEFLAHAWVEVDGAVVVGARRGEWFYPLPDLGAVLKSGGLR